MPQSHPWRVLREHLLPDRSPWLRVVEQDVALPDGSRGAVRCTPTAEG